MIDTKEQRLEERYLVVQTLGGSFGAAAIRILDLSQQGMQIEHPQPLRLATRSRLWFKRGSVSLSVHGVIIWSRLSRTPNAEGKLLYLSGIRLEAAENNVASAIQELSDQGVIRRDPDSLNRKRKLIQQKEDERSAPKTVVKVMRMESTVSADESLLIQHARERLRSHPDEAKVWYDRARYSIVETGFAVAAEIRNREDVLAVWEYLERSLPLSTIARAFDEKK